MSPADICKKHGKDDPASCAREMEELKGELGEKGWETFAKCAGKAEDEASMGVCLMKVQVMEERGETGMSPASICKKHGKVDPAKCTAELEQLKGELGSGWDEFARCAARANDEAGMGACILAAGKKSGEL